MKIIEEIGIREFKPWSGAKVTVDRIINEGKADEFDDFIEHEYPNGITSTELNDLLWFDSDWIYQILGMEVDEEDIEDDEDLLDIELNDTDSLYHKEFDLTNKRDLDFLAEDNDIKTDEGSDFLGDLIYWAEKVVIPYKDVLVWANVVSHGSIIQTDDEIRYDFDLVVDPKDSHTKDLIDDVFYDEDVTKKYILELAGSDTKITPAELLKRNSKERLAKFIIENNLIDEDTIESLAQEAYDKEFEKGYGDYLAENQGE